MFNSARANFYLMKSLCVCVRARMCVHIYIYIYILIIEGYTTVLLLAFVILSEHVALGEVIEDG